MEERKRRNPTLKKPTVKGQFKGSPTGQVLRAHNKGEILMLGAETFC